MKNLNETHDPNRKSWVAAANEPQTDFPIQNLPWGVFSEKNGEQRVGVAIGDHIFDVTEAERVGLISPGRSAKVFNQGVLNPFMALPQAIWSKTRAIVADLLDASNGPRTDVHLVSQSDADMHLPIFVRSYTDFYASIEHATNVGTMFRGSENALPPNWLHIPIGYNGRASSVVVSGTQIHRPWGQIKGPNDELPRFAPSERFDCELELGAIVGQPSELGQPVTSAEASDMIFGYVLLNDWSARDIQAWEYQPLGPFQSKATATTISPWIVTREALEPFRTQTPKRHSELLPYLQEEMPNNFNIALEVELTPDDGPPNVISRTNCANMYYSSAQQLAHHSSSGCAMCTGDLIGSGTISGESHDSYGSLLELSWGGKEPITLKGGTTRTFIEDGDTLVLRGHCRGENYRLGFGECVGQVLSAIRYPGLTP
ncbi:MAG: fumarylacetoacetase [Hyphomicrobiaceae bacterium]